jgi:hypothetical protein
MLNQGSLMKATLIAGLVLVAAQVGLGAQDSLTAAKDLYASAAYEDALSTLTRLTSSVRSMNTARSVCTRSVARAKPNRSRRR